MGSILSRWKAKPTTVELLESIDKEIMDLEEFRSKNQRLLKLWVGRLLFYSSVLYLITCVGVYFCYLPDDWMGRLILSLPFFAFPLLVWFIRKLLVFLFSKRTEINSDKLDDLKTEKRKILEKVMETETYKNAKLILERFDPQSKSKVDVESSLGGAQMMTPRPGQDVRQRVRPSPAGTPSTSFPAGRPPAGRPHGAPGGPPETPGAAQQSMRRPVTSPCSLVPGVGLHPPGPSLPRPILPRERGAVDRVIEYLVGDGPQNRYALICQQCFSHNGMALKEEFEYVAFRCAYCYFLNPARKVRPQAPRLPEFSFERRIRSDSATPGPSTTPATLDDARPATTDGEDLDVSPMDDLDTQAAEEQPGGAPETEEAGGCKREEMVATEMEDMVGPETEIMGATEREELVLCDTEEMVAPETEDMVGPETEDMVGPDTEEIVAPEWEELVARDTEEMVAPEAEEPRGSTHTS